MISFSTAGIKTARVWKERGYDFRGVAHNDGRNLVFVAGNHGHINMLEFLRIEIGMDLCEIDSKGESTIEFVFRRAQFDCFYYLLKYFINNRKFEIHSQIPPRIIENIIVACKQANNISEVGVSVCQR